MSGSMTVGAESTQDSLYAIAMATLPSLGFGGTVLPEDVHFIIREGHGARVISTQGREYVDFVCGAGATIIGHDHPQVVDAMRERIGKGVHFFGTLNEPAVELADVLVASVPCAERILFTTTGSEATAYAMRIARAATGRSKILKFEGAYHGNHDYATFSQFPTKAANYPNATADSGGVPRVLSETMLVAPYNDLQAVSRILDDRAAEIAAIIVEPVQRIIFATPEFLKGLRELANKHHILLIFDEVVTGFRLSYGGAQEFFGVVPDLATYAKIAGGGGPLGFVAGRADVMDHTSPSRKGRPDYAYINGTLHGNPLAAVASIATLKVLRTPDFYAKFHRTADRFRSAMQAALTENELPAIVAGQASFWQILFTDRPPLNQMDVLASNMKRSLQLDIELLRNGVFVMPNVRKFYSAAHNERDLEATLIALNKSGAALR